MKSVREIFDILPGDGYGLISCEELQSRLNSENPPVLLDIRKKTDWDLSRIAGSIHREWDAVGGLIESGILSEERDIVVICYVGQSSGQVTGVLRTLGYRAYSLLDGFDEWNRAGYSVETAAEVS
jgi:rhodanese-related sulfurtransferase